ncbi:hypothetical protein SPOG_00981 [Schizosaccharomyces cryophilus OY26]|uniref:Uncharacterized protein n=1 Tax=Schizosaccharomyces cryophilus (strain OY26 / ATCC MYA-4695 / CBS 11777 / NBRC 106824 / NRRL Y48691) TaxID=653667 RepID=S9VVQ9_SCHCR|nr:uncharacterized protein SPOG_00981 [Schizosaccharomyces cryophilus OY26]EPY50220.1 hypothetical protein SPOG_00981 [Schizosaccharomyces cryophilus OY26]
MYSFLEYQEIDPTEDDPTEDESEPIVYFRYKSSEFREDGSKRRIFAGLLVISSSIGMYLLIRWLRNLRNLTFTQFLLFVWFFAFLSNLLMKRIFIDEDITNQPILWLVPVFSYLFGDGIERSLFNSFALALSLGLGYLRCSSENLVFLVILLGCVQSLFMVIAPLIFPILYLVEPLIAKPLQLAWMLSSLNFSNQSFSHLQNAPQIRKRF